MALVDLDTPDDADEFRDDIAARVVALVFGAILLRFGLRMWALIEPVGLAGAVPTLLAFAVGVQLMVLSVADVDYAAIGRPLGYAVTIVVAALTLWLMVLTGLPKLGTDVLAFTSYAVEVVAEGGNPFAVSMAPSHQLAGAPDTWTPRTDGSIVESWSYPGGTLWVYGIQYQTIGRTAIGLRLTSLVGVAAIGLLITAILPPTYGLLGPASLVLAQQEFAAAMGGLNDMWWVLGTVAALWLWAIDRRIVAAAAFGLACAMKQQPWIIALPLAIWTYRVAPDWRTFGRRAAAYIGVGGAAFVAANLPWLAVDPAAWAHAVLTPLGIGNEAPLVSKGVGLAIVNQAVDGRLVTRGQFEALIYVSVAVATLAYWHWFEQLRWAAWVLPAVVFLWTPRSLPSYFHWFVPIAIVAAVAAQGRLRGQSEVTIA